MDLATFWSQGRRNIESEKQNKRVICSLCEASIRGTAERGGLPEQHLWRPYFVCLLPLPPYRLLGMLKDPQKSCREYLPDLSHENI